MLIKFVLGPLICADELQGECMSLRKALVACQTEKQQEVARFSATVSQKSFEHKELKVHSLLYECFISCKLTCTLSIWQFPHNWEDIAGQLGGTRESIGILSNQEG
jgi:hypothetical protein